MFSGVMALLREVRTFSLSLLAIWIHDASVRLQWRAASANVANRTSLEPPRAKNGTICVTEGDGIPSQASLKVPISAGNSQRDAFILSQTDWGTLRVRPLDDSHGQL